MDRRRPRRQPFRHRRGAGVGDARAKPQGHGYLLEQLHQLGAELSTTTSLIEVPDVELMRLAEQSPDRSPHRLDEPYRRAIAGFYARLAATALRLDNLEAPRHAVAEAEPYASAAEFGADLDVLHRALISHNCGLLGRGRLRRLRHAVAIFGFHLAPLDLRQNSDVHARTVAELLAIARPGSDYLALDEDGRIALLLDELATPRPLTAPGVNYSDETRGELAIFHTAQSIHQRYGKAAIENVIISKTDGVSDILEVAVLLKEVGLLRPLEHALDVNIVPLFETIGDLANAGPIMDRLLSIPLYNRLLGSRQALQEVHARLFRQQQGRRLPDLGLGAVPRRDRADRGLRPPRCHAAPVPRPRRFGRPRRRPELPGHPRPAAGRGAGPDPHHRTGRSDRLEIRQPGAGPAQPGNPRRRHAGSHAAGARARCAAPRIPRGDGRTLGQRLRRLSGDGLRDAGLRAVLLGIHGDRRNRRAQHRQPAGLAQEDDRHRGPARDPLGVLLGAVPPDAAGLVRLRRGGRAWRANTARPAWRCWRRCTASGASSATLLSNMDMVLGKSDIVIAERYSLLVKDEELRQTIFPRLKAEWQASIDALLAITGERNCSTSIRC
jgi:hypothetical protein